MSRSQDAPTTLRTEHHKLCGEELFWCSWCRDIRGWAPLLGLARQALLHLPCSSVTNPLALR